MEVGYLLFEFPERLFAILKEFALLMATPVEGWVVDLLMDIYETFVWIIDKLDVFGIYPQAFTDFSYFVVDVLSNAPLGIWVLVVCLTLGAIFGLMFYIVDVIDRINFLT